MRAKVLLYRLDGGTENGAKLRAILREMKILTLTVEANQINETVGRLVSTNAAASDAAPPENAPEAEFMLLCALGDKQLDRLIANMRRAGVSVPYKAVLTEHNRDWQFGKLIGEIIREHEFLKSLH